MKLENLKGKLVILCDQNEKTETQSIAYVKNIKNNEVQIASANSGITSMTREKLKNEYASDNWLCLEEFFNKAEVVGKKIAFEQPDFMSGEMFCLFQYKDIQLIAQLNGTNIQSNIISTNIHKNSVTEETLVESFQNIFEGLASKLEINLFAGKLLDKDAMLQNMKELGKQEFSLYYNDNNEKTF